MTRVALILILATEITACALPPAVEIPREPALPREWGAYRPSEFLGTDCPKIGGTFRNSPQLYTVKNNVSEWSRATANSFYLLFGLNLAKQSIAQMEFSANQPDVLVIEQASADQLTVTHIAPDLGKVIKYKFFRSEHDFDCVGGFIQFPVRKYYGSHEGGTVNGQNVDKLRLTESGDLIAIKSFGPFRSTSANASNEFTHEFYLFERL